MCCLTFAQAVRAEFDDMARIFRQTADQETLSDSNIEICQGGGCAVVSKARLTIQDWQKIKQIFIPLAINAEQERHKIAVAIGDLETIIGQQTGTSQDRAGTFGNSDYSGQQDCNDEAINTTSYMRLLAQAGLILFHEIKDLRTRNFFFNGWPHTTAVIKQVDNGERFAVDSWFYNNGHAATIVPFSIWKKGYQPKDSPIGKD